MKHPNIIAIILGSLLLVAAQAVQAANDARNLKVTGAGKRVALLIGNDRYGSVPALKNAVADARSMAAALERAGFAVTLKTDANLAAMKLAVRQFKAQLSGGDEAVFFYSGHGVQLGAANYLLPVDITSDNEEQVKDDAIPLQRLLDDLQDQKVKFALAIIDACRDNPFKGHGRNIGGTRGLAPTSAANGQMVIFSAGAGQQALDKLGNNDRDKNGVFTRVFLQEMQKPGVEVHQVLRNVRSRVVAMAKSINHDQMPALYDQVEGDFHFYRDAGDGTQIASLVPVPSQQPARLKTKDEIEQDSWDSVRDSNNIDAVNEYLKQYPKGRFAGQAKILIATLKAAPAKPAEPVEPATPPSGREDGESALWNEAQKGNSKEDYQAYLDQYPKGKYVALAKSRIKKLQDDAQAAAEQQEQQAWQAAQDENSEASYTRYLKGYPNGRYAGLAKARQEKLKNDVAAKEEAELWKKAESGNDKNAVEAYLNKYPSGRYVAAAGDKLKAIKEEEAKGPAMVRIPGRNYELGKYAVTQKEWREVMGSNPSHFSSCGDTCPVEQVSWNDVHEFLQKLNAKTGRQYRLPDEAEWEYACAGGSQNEYCGSNNINSVAWYKENSNSTTHPVGQKQANGYGLYDMSGNVWQWMENCYDSSCGGRVLRGGSWYNVPVITRSALRNDRTPASRDINYGFRVARTLP